MFDQNGKIYGITPGIYYSYFEDIISNQKKNLKAFYDQNNILFHLPQLVLLFKEFHQDKQLSSE
jgi:hypothetical protein